MKKLALLLLLFPTRSFSQFCPSCIANSAAPQVAQINIGTATIRGTLTASTGTFIYVNALNLNITGISGSGAQITGLNASQLASGTVPGARLAGAYAGVTGLGTIASGVWQGTPIGTQYGGTGKNWVNIATGSIIYFDNNGSMSTLSPGSPQALLQTNGNSPPVWTSSPAVSGINIYGIKPSQLANGNLPPGVAVSSNSIAYVNGASVFGNINGLSAGTTGTILLSQLSTGTLPTTVVASSITVTGVKPGTYGGPYLTPQYTVGADGRLTYSTQTATVIQPSAISPGILPGGVTVDPRQVSTGTFPTTAVASSITATGVTAGVYGGPTNAVQLTIGGDGRVSVANTFQLGGISTHTAFNNVDNNWSHSQTSQAGSSWTIKGNLSAFLVGTSSVTGYGAGLTHLTAANIDAGTLPANVIASSVQATGVTAGTYGSATLVPQITVGGDGRLSLAGNVSITGVPASSVPAAGILPGQISTGVFLNAGSLNNGPVASSILPSTVAYTSVANNFTAAQTVSAGGGLAVTYGVVAATFTGNGAALTNIQAGALVNGPVASSILPSTVAYTSVANDFTAAQGIVGFGLTASSLTASGIGADGFSATTSSGVNVGNGPVYLNSGGYVRYPDGTTQDTAFPLGVFVQRSGDSMTGPLTMTNGSTITVQGNAFSIGGSTLSVSNGNVTVGSTLTVNGRIGIGTSNPLSILTVQTAGIIDNGFFGGINLNKTVSQYVGLRFDLNGTPLFRIGTTPADDFQIYRRRGVTNDDAALYIKNLNGYVGIQTTQPAYPLDVNGDIHGVFNLYVLGSSNLINPVTIGSTLTVNGNAFSVGGSSLIVAQGGVNIGGGLTASSGTFTNIGASNFSLQTSSGINVINGPIVLGAGGSINYFDGTKSTTAATGSGGGGGGPTLTSTNPWSGANSWSAAATFLSPSTVTILGKDPTTGYSLSLSSGVNMPSGTVNAGLIQGTTIIAQGLIQGATFQAVGSAFLVGGTTIQSTNATFGGTAVVLSTLTVGYGGNKVSTITVFGSIQMPSVSTITTPVVNGSIIYSSAVFGGTGDFYLGLNGGWFPISTGTANVPAATCTGTGGTITQAGGYCEHYFTTSGGFTPPVSTGTVYIEGCAGGAGGGSGGGGAGGCIRGEYHIGTGSATVTVGGGGTATTNATIDAQGGAGSNSVFGSSTATGGGGGGGAAGSANNNGAAGGSGGGGGATGGAAYTGGAGTAGQGNNGGASNTSAAPFFSGGGGGCGAVGQDDQHPTKSGDGGAGCSSIFTSGPSTFGGGGGGGTYSVGTAGTGGSGGGGNGGNGTTTGTNGTANTGGGGGGGGSAAAGGNGGSGFWKVRYPIQ